MRNRDLAAWCDERLPDGEADVTVAVGDRHGPCHWCLSPNGPQTNLSAITSPTRVSVVRLRQTRSVFRHIAHQPRAAAQPILGLRMVPKAAGGQLWLSGAGGRRTAVRFNGLTNAAKSIAFSTTVALG